MKRGRDVIEGLARRATSGDLAARMSELRARKGRKPPREGRP